MLGLEFYPGEHRQFPRDFKQSNEMTLFVFQKDHSCCSMVNGDNGAGRPPRKWWLDKKSKDGG